MSNLTDPSAKEASAAADTPPPPATPPAPDSVEASYFEKLLAFIPADMVAGYLALDGILKQTVPQAPWWMYWAVFGAMLALTPLYVCFRPTPSLVLKCSMRFRAITATLAFAVWVFALGGPFETFSWYLPVYGSVLLIVTTLTLPVAESIGSWLSAPKSKR